MTTPSNQTRSDQGATNLSSLRMRYGLAVAILHAVQVEADTRVVVFGDPEMGSYDWGIERHGKIEQHSDSAYGSLEAALRDGLTTLSTRRSPRRTGGGRMAKHPDDRSGDLPSSFDKLYRKRPVVIEAVQWHSHGDHEKVRRPDNDGVRYECHESCGVIDTLEGKHIVSPGDWIIKGVKGEHYACKPDIFDATYERADNPLVSATATSSALMGKMVDPNGGPSPRSTTAEVAQPSTTVTKRDFATAEKLTDAYIEDYHFEGDEGIHTPTEGERILMKDCVMGLLAEPDFLAALGSASPSSLVAGDARLRQEIFVLTDVLNRARETLLISIKGTPDELQRSLGRLNLACKAHWDWQTEKAKASPSSVVAPDAYLVEFYEVMVNGDKKRVTMASLEPTAPAVWADDKRVESRELIRAIPLFVASATAARSET